MIEQRLYIDGQLVDIDDGTRLTLNMRSNLFQDISRLVSNNTFTVRLPKTVRNQRIFVHADKVQNGGSVFPYMLHTARYYRDGVELISNGRAVCLSVTTSIEISIVWGLFPALEAIQSNGTTLNQLESDAHLKWSADAFDTYSAAMARGYFYASYNPFHVADSGDEWTSIDSIEGALRTTVLSLSDGAIETGESVGEIILAERDATQTDYACIVAPFTVGDTLRLTTVVGGATTFRLYAVLDAESKVLELGAASTEQTVAADVTVAAPANAARIVVNVVKARSTGYTATITSTTRSDRRASNMRGNMWLDYVHPSVLASWVLGLIKEQTGVHFKWSGEAAALIDQLAIPLISNKSTSLTTEGVLNAELVARAGLGTLQVRMKSASNLFSNEAGSTASALNAIANFSVFVDVQGHWSWDASMAQPHGSTTYTIDGVEVTTYNYTYPFNYIEMKITPRNGTEDDVRTYIIGDANMADGVYGLDKSDDLVNGRFKHIVAGYGRIDIEAGDTVTFEMKNSRGTLHDTRFEGGTIEGSLDAGDTVPRGGYFPIAYNLPKIKITDFVKFLACITGTFPRQIDNNGEVVFVPFAILWDNIAQAQDWTRRIVAQSLENKPKELEFKIGDYAQRNTYQWAEDDTVSGHYDGVLTVNNKTLDESKEVFTFPFAASDGARVPHYTKPTEKGVFGGQREATTAGESASYQACKDRILQVYETTDGKAALKFDLNMQQILNDKYKRMRLSLQAAKVIKERVILSDVDLLQFDETKPVYLAQYGAFFAVTEIKQSDSGSAEVTMFQISTEQQEQPVPLDIHIVVKASEGAGYNYTFTWQASHALTHPVSINIASITGVGDLNNITLPQGATDGNIAEQMADDFPISVAVNRIDASDANTYTGSLMMMRVISITLAMGEEPSTLKYTVSEPLQHHAVRVPVVVMGAQQHHTTVTIPASVNLEGVVNTADAYAFFALVSVENLVIKEDGDFNEYTASKAEI